MDINMRGEKKTDRQRIIQVKTDRQVDRKKIIQ